MVFLSTIDENSLSLINLNNISAIGVIEKDSIFRDKKIYQIKIEFKGRNEPDNYVTLDMPLENIKDMIYYMLHMANYANEFDVFELEKLVDKFTNKEE